MKEDVKGITAKKDKDFSEWYTQVIQKAELADIRFGIQGFIVHQSWGFRIIRKIYEYLEKEHHLKLPRNSVPLEVDQFVLFIGELAKWLGQRKENENDLPISLLVSSETRFHVDGQAELKAGSARYGDFELYVDQDDDRRNFGFSLDVIPYAMEGSSEFHPEIHGSFAAIGN